VVPERPRRRPGGRGVGLRATGDRRRRGRRGSIFHWFLIVTSFGSLFLVSGKRTAEHIDLGEDRASHRSTLGDYSLGFLHHVRSVSAAVAVASYCLWGFERADIGPFSIWFPLSIMPFVLVNLRYAVLLDAGRGGCPEELVLEDRALQVLGLLWVVSVAAGIYGA
jgi:decaprenyl-phosphate phosphoribosyltransferase